MLFYLAHFLCIVNLRWYVFWYSWPTPHKYEPAFVPLCVFNVRLVIVQIMANIEGVVIDVNHNTSGILVFFCRISPENSWRRFC